MRSTSIAGLSYRQDGRVRHNAVPPLTPLDSLPSWPYERVDMPRYFHRHYLGERVGAHHSSYGCPHACSFCAVVGIANRRWVAESPERVERVLRLFQTRYGADAVQFHDMDFFISESRTNGDGRAHRATRDDVVGAWSRRRVDALRDGDLAANEAERSEDDLLRRRVGIERDAASR